MNKLIFMNDVSTDIDKRSLLVGSRDVSATEEGLQQSVDIAKYFISRAPKINVILTSDASRISRLVHCIRFFSEDNYLTRVHVKVLDSLRERSFGVLTGTPHSLDSEIFTHSRICPEEGESVGQCRDRAVYPLKVILDKNPGSTLLVVSHPFVCQIVTNFFLGKAVTFLTDFWFKKGSVVMLVRKDKPGWSLEEAYNSIEERDYKLEEICGN